MKRYWKRSLSLLLCLVLSCSLAVPAFAAEKEEITNVNEAFMLVVDTELIDIYGATLYADGQTGQNVYYVVCKGLDFSEFDPDQPRSYANAIKLGLSCENNSYVKTLIKAVKEVVPTGSDVVFLGHSMGGMVIEQAIAQDEIKDNYNVLYSLAIGSPYILTKSCKEGTLNRVVDRLDPVGVLSIPLLANPYMGNVSLETSWKAPLVHFRSYEDGTCWNCYDCLGVKNGSAYITLDELLYSAED